jgi:hypothetical protein
MTKRARTVASTASKSVVFGARADVERVRQAAERARSRMLSTPAATDDQPEPVDIGAQAAAIEGEPSTSAP